MEYLGEAMRTHGWVAIARCVDCIRPGRIAFVLGRAWMEEAQIRRQIKIIIAPPCINKGHLARLHAELTFLCAFLHRHAWMAR
jgi:hypothetical protein